MNKKTKIQMLIASLAILLPMIPGFILWDKFPVGASTPEKLFMIAGIPLIMLLIFFLCVFFTEKDPNNQKQSPKVMGLIFALIPMICYYSYAIIFFSLMGKGINVYSFTCVFLGLLFLILGNYMPKCTQNRYMGIKIKWTLSSKENWNATHRFAGKVWFAGSIPVIACALLPKFTGMIAASVIMVVLVVSPAIYSYVFYRNQLKKGTYENDGVRAGRYEKPIMIVCLVIVAASLALCAMLMFVGDVEIAYGENSFTVDANTVSATTVEYEKIESIEYVKDMDRGTRTFGTATTRLLAGSFTNKELGTYRLYSYTKCDDLVVLKIDGKYLAISGENEEATYEIYEELLKLCEN